MPAIAVAIAWALISYRTPTRAVLWFPFVLPLYVLRAQLGPLPTTALELAFIAMTFVTSALQGCLLWRAGLRRTKPWHLPAALWILATVIAVFVAPHHWNAFGLWRAYVLEPMLYGLLLAGTLKNDKDRATIIKALVGAVTLVSAIAILQYIDILPIPYPWNTDFWTRRATGPFSFPNALSLFCAPISALCIGKILAGDKQQTLTLHSRSLWLGYFSGTLSTILAKSIGGFLAILVATLMACLWNNKTRRATIILSTLIVMGIAATPSMREPIESAITFKTWSGKVRLTIWNETAQMLKARPILGAGFGAYPESIKPYHTAKFIEIFQYPHNLLLNLWSETGIVGIFAFGWICCVWIRSCMQYQRISYQRTSMSPPLPIVYCLLPLVTIFIHGLVDVPYFKNDLAFLFWILASTNIPVSTTSS